MRANKLPAALLEGLAAGLAFLESARREAPEVLEALSMVVGNRKIMVDVIRDAVADFIAGRETR